MLSVIIISKNEERGIQACLESVSFADEIIVVDSGSEDQTISIAQKFTPHVYIENNWQGYGVQKQRALSYAKGTWVLNLDADEIVSSSLRDKIIHIITEDKVDGCRIPIKLNFYQKYIRYSTSPTRHVRLFRRAGAKFSEDIVHEKIILPAHSKIIQLSSPIIHNSFEDLSHALTKLNRYSSYSAAIRLKQQKKPRFYKTIFASIWMFFRCYILQGGFLDKKEGFILAALNAQGTFFRGMKQVYPDHTGTNIKEK